VDNWAHNERNSRFDSNSCVIKSFKHPITGENIEHAQRFWELYTVNGRHDGVLQSDENWEYKAQTGKDMGRTHFFSNLLPVYPKAASAVLR
jgi:hypothetical protein